MELLEADYNYVSGSLVQAVVSQGLEGSPPGEQGRGLGGHVVVWRGRILLGEDIYEACLQAGADPVLLRLPDDVSPIERVIDEATALSHLSRTKRAVAAHRFWELSNGDWADLVLPDGEAALLPRSSLARYSRRWWATLFGVSEALVNHAGKVFGEDLLTIPELQQAAWEGRVSVSDASRAAGYPGRMQREAMQLVRDGSARTISRALEQLLPSEESQDQQEDARSALAVPTGGAASSGSVAATFYCLPVKELHHLLEPESVDAIFTIPTPTSKGIGRLADLVALADEVLKPTGLLGVLGSHDMLPRFIEGLSHPRILWICSLVLIFPKTWREMQGMHRLSLRARPLLLYGKAHSRIHPGGDIISVPENKALSQPGRDLESALIQVVRRYSQVGQVILDPEMRGQPAVALAAQQLGRPFIGADVKVSRINRIRSKMAAARSQERASRPGPDQSGALQAKMQFAEC